MSDTSQGPGWWMASDGKWYPPELWTGPPEARPGGALADDPTASASGSAFPSEAGGQPNPAAGSEPGSTQPGMPTPSDAPSAYGMPNPSGAPNAYGQPPAYTPPGPYPGGSYPTYGYEQPSPYQSGIRKKTNGLAIASLVCGIAGVFFISAVLGVIFGFVARSQIRNSSGTQGGEGLALAGIIVGFAWIVLLVIIVAVSGKNNQTNNGVVLLHLAAGLGS